MQTRSPGRTDAMRDRLRDMFRGKGGIPPSPPVILVTGPESSGTRIWTDIFSRHPGALGTGAAHRHEDALDTVWQHLARGRRRDAVELLGNLPREKFVITRRSMPHGSAPGAAARFGEFPDLGRFADACVAASRRVQLLITSRSPAACIASSVAERASVAGNPDFARRQYVSAYNEIFAVIARRKLPFLILSLEALMLDGDAYVQSLFGLCGMGPARVDLPSRSNPNTRRYGEFFRLAEARP